MKGVIASFRRGRHTQTPNQMVIMPDTNDSKSLVGKAVLWKSPSGREIEGKITALHGRKGCVRAYFKRGMPGQSLGQVVEIQG